MLPSDSSGEAATESELDEAFAAFGLIPEGELELNDDFYLWPENFEAFNFWLAVQTQWSWHDGRRTGLNYAGIEARIRYWTATKQQRQRLFQQVCSLEGESLQAWSELRK